MARPATRRTQGSAERCRPTRDAKERHDLPGKDMVLFGGNQTVQRFVQLGLVDEYWIKLYPVALGTGQPIYTNLAQPADLRLVDSKTWDSGIVTLRYIPA